MKKTRKPLPTRRTDTITRVNVQRALAHLGEKATAYDVANWIVQSEYKTAATKRHVERAGRLMVPK